jgi:hypothetical protein
VSFEHRRAMLRQLLPGMVLPGAIYFVSTLVFGLGVIAGLACTSSVSVIDVLSRVLRGKRPTGASLLVLAAAGFSVAMAVVSGSPLFVLLKGAVVSMALGLAFAVSAIVNRPLTRTFALRLSSECPESRRTLAEKWCHPKAVDIFKALSFGWAALLLVSGGQQLGLAFVLSPGAFIALERPVTTAATAFGVFLSVMYVRRFRQTHPELGLLPARG